MASIVKVDSSNLDNLKRRVVKFLRLGKSDVRTSIEIGPFGTDSNPPKGIMAVYGQTDSVGKSVIIGYLNINQLAAVGDHRIFSTNSEGVLKGYLWLKNDGTAELMGNSDHLVRYSKLEEAFNKLKSEHDDLVNAFNTHMHATAATGPPSTPTPGSGIPAIASTADISPAKIVEIKTL